MTTTTVSSSRSALTIAAALSLAGLGACASAPAREPLEQPPLAARGEAGVLPATTLAERRTPDPANVVYDPALFSGLGWDWVGPARGGRVTAVTGVRGHPGTYYFGGSGSGVWRTTDYGRSWENLSDGWLETPSIGAVRVAPSDPDVIWVATGSDGLRSNVITGLGAYRSTDGGKSWRFLGLRDVGNAGAVEVDPRDANVAFVAAIGHPFGANPERGLYRTRDGGENWEKVLFVSDSTGIVDVEIDPSDPDVLYAASWRAERKPWTIISGAREGGIYKSTDGGDSWTRLAGGLPTGEGELFGKIDLALARSDPRIVYALIEAPEPKDGLYRSDDGGASWTQVSSDGRLLARPFYYTNVDVDPTDPDVVWVNDEGLYRSSDGGRTWARMTTPHGDNHDIRMDPDDPLLMVQGNDGGANVSRDGGRTWSSQLNQPTAEIYQIAIEDRYPYWVWGGQQDREIVGVPTRPTAAGPDEASFGGGTCETGPAVPKPGDRDVVYAACKGRFMVWDWRTGAAREHAVGAVNMYGTAPRDLPYRFQRVTAVEVSPHDPNTVYHGSQYVHRTRDGGITWERISPDLTATPPGTQGIAGEPITRDITGEEVYSTLYAIEESPVRAGVIWTGSYDGRFHVTRDGGTTWTDVTPAGLASGGRVQSIDASTRDAASAIFSVVRFMLDDWRPLVYRTRDYGRTWTLLTSGSNGIPADYPVRVVREDPVRTGLLYAGSDFGVFASFDDGAHWQPLELNLPAVPVTDIALEGGDVAISTMGRGFWVMRDVVPLRGLRADIARAPGYLFDPAEAVLATWRSRGERDAVMPQYGEPGAVLDWVLSDQPKEPVVIELLDSAGAVINRWPQPSRQRQVGEEEETEAPQPRGGPAVPSKAGHTRATIPLEHAGPWRDPTAESAGWGGASGPALAPGEYAVRVRTGDWSATRPLTVVMDPRTDAAGVSAAALRRQEALALQVRDLLSESRRTLATVDREIEKAEGAGESGGAAARSSSGRLDRLRGIHSRLTEHEGIAYPQPMLVEQIQYLYGSITGTAQDPGNEAAGRYRALRRELTELKAELESITDG